MPDNTQVNDVTLETSDVRQLENADEIAHLFAKLRYDVNERTEIRDYNVLGLGSEDMRQHIHKIELIGKDPEEGDIVIYLFEVRSITAKLRNEIARRFRERPENAILVLTKDYSELEFVLLERVVSRSESRRTALKQSIRPIPLSVNRQKIDRDSVQLRVLKRFTFTEADAAYQWEKLRSAYMLAEWSEQYFNNRALFSDYYLKQRLTDEGITPEWKEDVKPIGRDVQQHLANARADYTGQTEDVIRKGLYEPLFKLLGFGFAVQKTGPADAEVADYLLYTPGDRAKPIAAVLTYVWNRNLDDVDEAREPEGGTPFEIPGAMVVSLLEKQEVPWVIVTNGKLWRLYSSTASNKATNYYEVDLEEALNARDREIALKYWWLMFRQQAFTGFLDKVLKESAEYAKELGDRLKYRVFVEIFPQFAKGFIADMRGRGVTQFDEAALATVFSGTMTFLYRLMFILYAESLELLPVSDAKGYGERSLYRLKHEIEAAGGKVLDEAPDKLGKHYKTSAANLYERLKGLFKVIDEGDDDLNMPTYNGGLFSRETDGGQFLDTYAIPDRYLALGLDRLARDVDDKTQALVFIDFKSLGVRHLGSIYEGLLEFKLKIAPEALAVTKEKGKEIYQPAKKLKGKTKTSIVIAVEKAEAYLENDRQERRATGSYYTPDYIVKYIVQHTVGPVLERKFDELRPRLREAQRNYRQARALAEKKGENPEKFWSLHEPRSPMSQLVDDCLNVRVLDPAMGSGHFLVEVVDFVSNRLITFLNGWAENPVWAFIDQTREDILSDMERQQVTIDADRLTRVSLLKRAVLKRCVYGVDLNLMAVELAKVSLWLDAFTLGAPLSFLDHHLKHGNSLIGAMDLSDVVAVGSKRWEMILDAAADMVSLSRRTDSTISQVGDSKTEYEHARAKLEDVKKYANVPIAAYFVDKINDYRKSQRNSGVVGQIAQIAYGIRQGNELQDLFNRAQAIAKEKCFFHWKLEYPEVFIDLEKRNWASDGGFDAVVGNPPYINIKDQDDDEILYMKANIGGISGRADIAVSFVSHVLQLLVTESKLSFIMTNKFLSAQYGKPFIEDVSRRGEFELIIDFMDSPIFEDAKTYPCIVIVTRKPTSEIIYPIPEVKIIRETVATLIPPLLLDVDNTSSSVFRIQGFVEPPNSSKPLGEICEWIREGSANGKDPVFILDKQDAGELAIETDVIRTFFYPSDFDRYWTNEHPTSVTLWPYDEKNELIDSEKYPNFNAYVNNNRSDLEDRYCVRRGGKKFYAYHDPAFPSVTKKAKLVTGDVALYPGFALVQGEAVFKNTCYVLSSTLHIDS